MNVNARRCRGLSEVDLNAMHLHELPRPRTERRLRIAHARNSVLIVIEKVT
jgi:hypothetical protein